MWTWRAESWLLIVPFVVVQLHRDYLRAGAEVLTTFTFYASDDKLAYQGKNSNGGNKGRTEQTIDVSSLSLSGYLNLHFDR